MCLFCKDFWLLNVMNRPGKMLKIQVILYCLDIVGNVKSGCNHLFHVKEMGLLRCKQKVNELPLRVVMIS